MKLSIVIPCYNEMHTIEAIVEKVLQVQMALERELIIVDDYSTDGTRRYLDRINGPEEIKIILHERTRGKGAALRSGFQHSTRFGV